MLSNERMLLFHREAKVGFNVKGVLTTMNIKGSDTIPFKRVLLLPPRRIVLFLCSVE